MITYLTCVWRQTLHILSFFPCLLCIILSCFILSYNIAFPFSSLSYVISSYCLHPFHSLRSDPVPSFSFQSESILSFASSSLNISDTFLSLHILSCPFLFFHILSYPFLLYLMPPYCIVFLATLILFLPPYPIPPSISYCYLILSYFFLLLFYSIPSHPSLFYTSFHFLLLSNSILFLLSLILFYSIPSLPILFLLPFLIVI